MGIKQTNISRHIINIAVDLDGTLLSSGNLILPETERVLRVASENGIKVVLATGRPLSGTLPFTQQLGLSGDDQYAIVFNGAVVHPVVHAEPSADRTSFLFLYRHP